MKISVVGGMDRLEPHYRNEVEKLGYELRLFNGLESHMAAKIVNSAAVVLFTGKISHEARNQVVAATKANNIPLLQCHSCGVCTLRECLTCFTRDEGKRIAPGPTAACKSLCRN
jgi:acyl-CoA synthetase (NDP forming)